MGGAVVAKRVADRTGSSRARPGSWLLSPTLDLLLFANLAWPVVALLVIRGGMGQVSWLQLYLFSSPHRWITIPLVLLDRERAARQPYDLRRLSGALLGFGAVLVLVGRAAGAATGGLALFMMVDYAWNAWHFAAQHAGVYSMYARRSELGRGGAQRLAARTSAIRVISLWMFLRLATVASSNPRQPGLTRELRQALGRSGAFMGRLDIVAIAAAVWLAVNELRGNRDRARIAYLLSWAGLYIALIVVAHRRAGGIAAGLTLAHAIFHAVEYISIVGWSVNGKRAGALGRIHRRLGLWVVGFMGVLMLANWLLASYSLWLWALVTLLVSPVHYGIDGVIWKSRPKTPVLLRPLLRRPVAVVSVAS